MLRTKLTITGQRSLAGLAVSIKEYRYPMRLYRLLPILTLLFVCATAVVHSDDASRVIDSTTNAKEVRQWEVTGPWGGDVRTLVASQDDSNLLYLGTGDGQIFRSTDGARTWRRL